MESATTVAPPDRPRAESRALRPPAMSLRAKVGFGALALTLISFLLLTLAWSSMGRMERAQARSGSANALLVSGEMLLRTARELMLTQGPLSARNGSLAVARDIEQHLTELSRTDADLSREAHRWSALSAQVDALLSNRLIDVTDDDSLIAYGRLIQGIEGFMPVVRDAKQRADQAADVALHQAAAWLVSGLLGLTALGGLAGLTLVKMLDHQLGGDPTLACEVAQRIASGELDPPVPHANDHPASVMAALEHVRIRLLERRAIEERVRFLARHDVLSGALNRGSFNDLLGLEIDRAGGDPGQLAVLYIDLDKFKEVNDTLGHAQGDEVIRQTSRRLRELLRRGDHLARLGGDEFAIIAHQVNGERDIEHLCQRIIESLTEPMTVSGRAITIGASIGVAILDATVADQEDLLHKADLAMYRAKANGRGGYSIYDEALDGSLRERHELVRELRGAIGTDQLCLHFQPIFGADAQQRIGYEALLRWRHPRRGLLPPSEFMPLAEDSGLTESIGDWVLQHACDTALRWPDPLLVSVNVSAAQVEGGRLAERIAHVLAGTGLPPARLQVEIAESLLIDPQETVTRTLEALSAQGVGLAMDNFGSGQSSLGLLWQLHFRKLKIDRRIVATAATDPRAERVIESIVSLAHALGMRVTAEGVEVDSQLSRVQASRCDEMQGFLLGRPAPDAHPNGPTTAGADPA